jgi:hypothetical protein
MTTSSDTTPASPLTVVHRDRPRESWFKRLFAFLAWLLTGFGLLGYLARGGRSTSEQVVVYAVHQSFFLWAIVLSGFVGAACARHWPNSAVVWGWLYLWVLLYTLVTLLFDVSTGKFLLWLGVFSFLWLICRYLEDVKHLPVLGHLLTYFSGLRPKLDPGFAAVVSWLLLPAWIGSLFHAFGRGRKTFTPNSIEEWYAGEGSEITDRTGLKFRTRYRDIFETFLGLGAGDLEAIDGSGHVVKRWPNILFLAFTWNRLDHILHERAATVENSREEPVEVEDVKRET